MDRTCGIPMTQLPLQVPQSIQGVSARPGKVVGAVLRHNNCGVAATAETLEQRRMVRNPAGTQYTVSNCSYPRRNPTCINERGADDGVESSNGLQPKPQYMARKSAAASGGPGGNWFCFRDVHFVPARYYPTEFVG